MTISQQWDAVVIGAGPAGAVSAGLLASHGYQVLLVDRKPLGRRKVCGCCWSAAGLALLDTIGLRERFTALGGIPLRSFHLRGPAIELSVPISEGLSVSREAGDAALVQFAVSVGAHVSPNTRAIVGEASESRRIVHLEDVAGRAAARTTVDARVVLAADGLGHPSLCHCPEFHTRPAAGSHIGAGCSVEKYRDSIERGGIHMALGREGYVGMVITEAGELNVAAALSSSLVQRSGGLSSAAQVILKQAEMPPIQSLADAHWSGTPHLTRRESNLAASRLFLLGDAAGYAEPFTGEGMTWAMMGALALQPLARQAIENWRPELTWEWTAQCRRMLGRRHLACRALAGLLRMPKAVSGISRWINTSPALASQIVRWVSGTGGTEAILRSFRNEPQAARNRHRGAAASNQPG